MQDFDKVFNSVHGHFTSDTYTKMVLKNRKKRAETRALLGNSLLADSQYSDLIVDTKLDGARKLLQQQRAIRDKKLMGGRSVALTGSRGRTCFEAGFLESKPLTTKSKNSKNRRHHRSSSEGEERKNE